MGFSGFGLIFRDSTMFRMRLCVFSDSLEALICQPERCLPPLLAGRSSFDCSCSSARALSTASQLLGVDPGSLRLGLRLVPLAWLLRLLWNRNWRSLATLLGIITRQALSKIAGNNKTKRKRTKKKQRKNSTKNMGSVPISGRWSWSRDLKWRWSWYPVYRSRRALDMRSEVGSGDNGDSDGHVRIWGLGLFCVVCEFWNWTKLIYFGDLLGLLSPLAGFGRRHIGSLYIRSGSGPRYGSGSWYIDRTNAHCHTSPG